MIVNTYTKDFFVTELNRRYFEGLLTKILKQRLYKARAIAIETAVHVDIRAIHCGKDKLWIKNRIRVRVNIAYSF